MLAETAGLYNVLKVGVAHVRGLGQNHGHVMPVKCHLLSLHSEKDKQLDKYLDNA